MLRRFPLSIFSLKRVKDKVWNARLRSPLFNTRQYAHNLEGLLLKVWRRHESGLEPDHVTCWMPGIIYFAQYFRYWQSLQSLITLLIKTESSPCAVTRGLNQWCGHEVHFKIKMRTTYSAWEGWVFYEYLCCQLRLVANDCLCCFIFLLFLVGQEGKFVGFW